MQQWLQVEGVQVVGFHDPHPEKCAAIEKEFGLRPLGSVDAVLEACQALDIVTPTTTHYDLARRAMELGRDLFIEKPVTNTVLEGQALLALAQEHGRIVQVGHVERFNPAFTAARPALKDPMFIETHRLAQFDPRGTDVSVVLDLMIHDIDIVLSVVDSPVADIHASGVAVVSDTPDIANARISFANGCVANLTASRISLKKMRKSRFFQRDAYISVDMLEKKTEIVRMHAMEGAVDPFAIVLDLGAKGKRAIAFDRPDVQPVNAIREELQAFAHAVRARTVPPVPLTDGLRALEVAHRVLEQLGGDKPK